MAQEYTIPDVTKSFSTDPVDVLHSVCKDPDAYHLEFAKIQRRKQSVLATFPALRYAETTKQIIKFAELYAAHEDVKPLRELCWRLDVSSFAGSDTHRERKTTPGDIGDFIRYVISNEVLPTRFHGTADDDSALTPKTRPSTGMDFIESIVTVPSDVVQTLMSYMFWMLCERHLIITEATYEEYDPEPPAPPTEFEAIELDPLCVRVVLALDITRTFDVPTTSIYVVPAKVTTSLSCITDVVISLAHLCVDLDALPEELRESATPSGCVIVRVVAGERRVVRDMEVNLNRASDVIDDAVNDLTDGFLKVDKDAKLTRKSVAEREMVIPNIRPFVKPKRVANNEDEEADE